jgi:hypothetical protein
MGTDGVNIRNALMDLESTFCLNNADKPFAGPEPILHYQDTY